LYITAIYFARANRIRLELPASHLEATVGQDLLKHLQAAQDAFGGTYGIYQTLQDSIGALITKPDGTLYTFRDYCDSLRFRTNRMWYSRLLSFYNDFESKMEYEVKQGVAALEGLLGFIREVSTPAAK
jgi:hypothetical protein